MSKTLVKQDNKKSRMGVLYILLVAVVCLTPNILFADELDFGLQESTVAKIEITGNNAFSNNEIKSIIRISEPRWFSPLSILGFSEKSSRYRPDLVYIELQLIKKFYRRNGFHYATATHDSTTSDVYGDKIYITINEGSQTLINSVTIESSEEVPEEIFDELQYNRGVPAPSDYNNLGPDIYLIRTHLHEKGYIKAIIQPEMTFSTTEDSLVNNADLLYRIFPGKPYSVSEIRIAGNSVTNRDIIKREIKLKEGELFKWSAVEETQLRLLETSLFRDVSFIPVEIDTFQAKVVMEVQVVEKKSAYIEFGAGVGSRERVRVLAAWGNNNVLGTGQKLRLKTRTWLNYEDVQQLSSGNTNPELNYRYELRHTHPSVMNRFKFSTSLFVDKETRGESGLNLHSDGLSFGSRFLISRSSVSDVTCKIEQTDPSLHPDAKQTLRDAFETSDLQETGTRSVALNYLTEKRNNPIRPQKGSLTSLLLEVAGGAMGGDNSFVKGKIDYHIYKSTFMGGVLASRISFGAVRPYSDSLTRGADGVPYQERFFAGGVSSVRGYQERSLGPQITSQAELDSLQLASDVPLPDKPARGGNYILLTNVEWRVPIPSPGKWKLGAVLFVDGGNVWERWHEIRLKGFRPRSYPLDPEDEGATKLWDYRWSSGVGLRFDTPVGPVRLDVGFPLKRARLSETEVEDKVMYHFSLGYPF